MRVRVTPAGGQRGYTLMEALIAILVSSIAIVTIASGLIASIRIDDSANIRQRMNLALATFLENLEYTRPAPDCADDPDGHAQSILAKILDDPDVAPNAPNPPNADDQYSLEVMQWVDERYMVFQIPSVRYTNWDAGDDFSVPETFTDDCEAMAPPPAYPVIEVTVEVCYVLDPAVTNCDGRAVERAVVIRRGNRSGQEP